MTADPHFGEVRRVLVDSTNVRAHRHAAGAARKSKHLGAAESARRQGLGRSRGGLTSKIVLTAADEDTAIAVDVRPGQAHDAPLLKPILKRTAARLDGVDQVVGSSRSLRHRSAPVFLSKTATKSAPSWSQLITSASP